MTYKYYPSTGVVENISKEKTYILGEYESKLLAVMLSQPGHYFSKEQLIKKAWAKRCVSSGSLTKAIHTLRYVFQDKQPWKIIMTVPGYGFYIDMESASHVHIANE